MIPNVIINVSCRGGQEIRSTLQKNINELKSYVCTLDIDYYRNKRFKQ